MRVTVKTVMALFVVSWSIPVLVWLLSTFRSAVGIHILTAKPNQILRENSLPVQLLFGNKQMQHSPSK